MSPSVIMNPVEKNFVRLVRLTVSTMGAKRESSLAKIKLPSRMLFSFLKFARLISIGKDL